MSIDIDMAEIAQLFIEESMEGLDIMESGLLNLDLGDADSETMNTIFRAAHSIKGGGATFGFTEISEFAHHVETLLDEMRQGERPVTKDGVDLMLQSVDCIREMINGLGDGEIDTTRSAELEVQLETMLNNDETPAELDNNGVASATERSSPEQVAVTGWEIEFKPHPGMLKSCNDPLRILKELESLGTLEVRCEGGAELIFGRFDPEECQLGWQLILEGDVERAQIDEAFAWVTDECDLKITAIPGDAERVVSISPSD